MERYDCDILVVGAGPSGSSAALTAARGGLNVLVVERRDKIGVPVRCAEYIPAPLIGEVDLGRHFVVQPVRGMRTFLLHGEAKETLSPGFTIRRDLFDQTLAEASRDAGAEVLLSTRALSRDEKGVYLKGKKGYRAVVRAKVIIGADGPRSSVGRWIGAVNRNLIPAVQVRVPLNRPMEFTEVYFDKEIYGGYGWLFPKRHEANVGLGMKLKGDGTRPITEVLHRFISRLADEGKIDKKPLRKFAGWIPAEGVRSAVKGNVMLVGDAAGHTHPITGAGVFQAVVCGRMAGKWAARAVKTDDMECLFEYEKEWRDLFEGTLQRAFNRRQLLEREWERLEEMIRFCWIAFREYYGEIS